MTIVGGKNGFTKNEAKAASGGTRLMKAKKQMKKIAGIVVVLVCPQGIAAE